MSEAIPDVNIDLFYRRYDEISQNTFDLGVGISLPLFDRSQGRLAEGKGKILEAEARMRLTLNELVFKVKEAHSQLERAIHAVKVLKQDILPKSGTILKGFESRYKAGEIGLSDVISARSNHLSMRLGYLESLRDTMLAYSDLSQFVR
jgi:cobalt-zinc-cadmium efflux system outer membrane protein